ncbi:MAG TPA: S41 family peptidase [Blastocatellia bacterium]|nr:S41 family peptidase [Blastocatellia bacterium]
MKTKGMALASTVIRPQHLIARCCILLIALCCLIVHPLVKAAEPKPSLDGYWLSDGYGYLAEINGNEMRLLEITAISCMLLESFKLQPEPSDPRGERFVSKQSGVLYLSPGPSPDSEWFQDPSAASKVLFSRVRTRPEVCTREAPNDPLTNFEVFAATFGAHHGFLKLRGVDWPAVTKTYRSKVSAQTKPEELFEIFRAMIEPLHDAHTFISASGIKRGFGGKRTGTLVLTAEEKKRTIEILETRYLESKLRDFCNGHLRYARLKGGAGYVRIDAFAGYVSKLGFDEGARALEGALDEIMQDAQGLKGLVIDVRINGGGADPYGIQIASRLTSKAYVGFVKRARNDAQNPESWTAPQPSLVRVSDRPRFLGPVIELIGPDTVSAGETFTMALMGRLPQVVRIGENTQGVYSDVLVRRLPNGWRFGLPNEVFLTEQGKHFEASGVPPDTRIPVFQKTDLDAGRDSALEKAIELLLGTPGGRR